MIHLRFLANDGYKNPFADGIIIAIWLPLIFLKDARREKPLVNTSCFANTTI
jgi:hypothetical protein